MSSPAASASNFLRCLSSSLPANFSTRLLHSGPASEKATEHPSAASRTEASASAARLASVFSNSLNTFTRSLTFLGSFELDAHSASHPSAPDFALGTLHALKCSITSSITSESRKQCAPKAASASSEALTTAPLLSLSFIRQMDVKLRAFPANSLRNPRPSAAAQFRLSATHTTLLSFLMIFASARDTSPYSPPASRGTEASFLRCSSASRRSLHLAADSGVQNTSSLSSLRIDCGSLRSKVSISGAAGDGGSGGGPLSPDAPDAPGLAGWLLRPGVAAAAAACLFRVRRVGTGFPPEPMSLRASSISLRIVSRI
mmetsp:Transcript_10002/g.25376  ORF Transcript_10002/g.25376 Transcript_10002/m.25376 type:complete len:315 (+) Transcript_10002:4791-5735(+)